MVAAYNFFELRKEWLEKALKIIQFSAFSSGGDFKEKSKKKINFNKKHLDNMSCSSLV